MNSYPVFKGLQKPLEFMGLQGRFIWLAGAAFGGAFFSFVIANFIAGTGAAFAASIIIGGGLLVLLYYKQHKGLYPRKKYRGVVIYQRLKVNHLK